MIFHDQKLERILELVKSQPYWTSISLAKELGISRSTVQKCLQELHDAGLVERIHGGVRRAGRNFSAPVSVNDRLGEDRHAKEMICHEAMKLMPAKGFIYIDAGTTTLPLAEQLARNGAERQLMCVTNDVMIASALAKAQVRHNLLGGQLHPVTQTISGPLSEEQLTGYQFDICFISVDSVWPSGTVTSALVEESRLKRLAMRQSNEKALLAATSKFVQKSGSIIGKIGDFGYWVTETANPEMTKLCETAGVQIIVFS
jgi:DeoR/GlpR family transcriptional regulator of sugar metabolism